MKLGIGRKFGLGLLLACLCLPSVAADRLQDRRGSRSAAVSSATSPDALVDLLLQMDLLQNEVKQLRNQVELQTKEIEQLQSRQRDLLQDLDQRVIRLEGGAPPVAAKDGATPASPEAAAVTPAAKTAATPAAVATRAQEQQEYDAAFNLMKQGFYERAVKAFRGFLKDHPQSPLAGNAQYWIAEANYVVRNFKLALEEFQKVPANYPNSPKVPDATLKIAYTYYELEKWQNAREGLQAVIDKYPNERAAENARRRLAKMKQQGH